MYTLKALAWLLLLLGGGGWLFWSLLRPADQRLMGLRPFGVALALCACGMLSPNYWAVCAAAAIALPLAARSRAEGAAIYLAAFLLLPDLGRPLVIGSLYVCDMALRDPLSLGMLMVMATHPKSRSPLARGRPLDAAFPLFFLVLAVIAARGRVPGDMVRQVVTLVLAIAVPYMLVSRSVREPRDFRRMLLVFGMAACALAIESSFEARRGWPLLLTLKTRFNEPGMAFFRAVSALRGGLMRTAGSFAEPISFSFFLAAALLACLATRDAFRRTWGLYLVVAVLLVGLFCTGARGGWLGAITAILLLDLFRRRYASLAAKGVLLAGAATLLLLAAQSSDWLAERIGTSGHAEATADYRQALFTRGMEEFHRAPILGQSNKVVTADLADLRQGEGIIDFVNYWLYILLTAGAVGTAVIAGAMITPPLLIAGTRRRLRERPQLLAIGGFLFAGGLMPMAAILFTSLDDRYEFIWTMNFAMAASFLPLVAAVRRSPAAAAQSPAESAPAQTRELAPAG